MARKFSRAGISRETMPKEKVQRVFTVFPHSSSLNLPLGVQTAIRCRDDNPARTAESSDNGLLKKIPTKMKKHRRRKTNRIQPIQHPPMPLDHLPPVLGAQAPLHRR